MAVAKRPADVFLNIPFADSHEYLYLALIAGLVALRLNPRCVLEIPPQQSRLQRLYQLIASCPYSIHDLSHVRLSNTGHRVPRFNMPFELGIAVAVAPVVMFLDLVTVWAEEWNRRSGCRARAQIDLSSGSTKPITPRRYTGVQPWPTKRQSYTATPRF